MTLAEKSRGVRQARPGAARPLGTDRRLAAARCPAISRPTRRVSTDNDGLWTAMYVAAECVPLQGDRRRRCARERAARHAGDHAARSDHRHPRIPRALVHQGRRRRSAVRRRMARHARQGSGAGRATPAPTRSSATTSSIRSTTTWSPTRTRSRRCAASSIASPTTSSTTTTSWSTSTASGRAGAGGRRTLIWEDADETGLRALHILSHLRVAMHLTANPQYRAKYQAAYDDLIETHRYHLLTRNQKIMVPGHINHSDDELAFLSFYPLLRYETRSGAARGLQAEPRAQLADRAAGAQSAVERHLCGRHGREGVRSAEIAAHAARDSDGPRSSGP